MARFGRAGGSLFGETGIGFIVVWIGVTGTEASTGGTGDGSTGGELEGVEGSGGLDMRASLSLFVYDPIN